MGNQTAPKKLTKVAVDRTTVDYWTEYFEEYGTMLTKGIARRVASALVSAVYRRTAQKAPNADFQVVRVGLVPRAKAAFRDQNGKLRSVKTEGFFRAVLKEGGKSRVVRRQFCAELDPKGNLLALDSVAL